MRVGKGAAGKYRCHGCGAARLTTSSHATLHCGAACASHRTAADEKHATELASAGFTRHADAPNLMVKGGFAVSLEQCWREGGTEKALAHHVRFTQS